MAVSAAILTRVPAAFLPLKPSLNSNRTNRKNRTKSEEKPPKQAVFLRKVVRVTGFEPAASCSQSRRATNCATPGYEVVGWPGRILPNVCLNLQPPLFRPLWPFPLLGRFLFRTFLPCLFQENLSSFGICVGLDSVY